MSFTQTAFLLSSISVVLCIWISYKIYKRTTRNLEKKGQRLLAQLSAISIAIGIGWISNEILGSFFLDLAIRPDFIIGKIITNIVFLPSIFYGIIWLRGGWRDITEHQVTTNSSTGDVKISTNIPTESHYEKALVEFESKEKKSGLYAKLFVEEGGDENKIKISYLKHRANEILVEEKITLRNQINAKEIEDSPLGMLKRKKYETGQVNGIECLLLANGMGVILTEARDYRVYKNEETMTSSAMYYKANKNYLSEGYIQTIKRNDVLFDDSNYENSNNKKSDVIVERKPANDELLCSHCKFIFKHPNMGSSKKRMEIKCPRCETYLWINHR
jgi:hypothetical protein